MSNEHKLSDLSRPEDYIGKLGVWHVRLQKDMATTVFVKIVDARRLWDRMDLEIETNTTARLWVSHKTVEVMEIPQTGSPREE